MSKLYKDYHEYLKSDDWKRKSESRKKVDNCECVICGSKENLRVHHIKYRPVFSDTKVKSELITLCENCHEEYHEREKAIKEWCEEARNEYLKRRKELDALSWTFEPYVETLKPIHKQMMIDNVEHQKEVVKGIESERDTE